MACFGGLAAMKELPPKREPIAKTFNVQVFNVQEADLQEVVVGFGTVKAEHDTVVSAQVAGQIANISQQLKVGADVGGPSFKFIQTDKQVGSQEPYGDQLIWIDRSVYVERQSAADTAIAEAEAMQANLKQEDANNTKLLDKATHDYQIALREHKKTIGLEADGSLTKSQLAKSELDLQQYEQAKIQYENMRDLFPKKRYQLTKQIERLNAELKLTTIDVDRTIVRPPFSGILSEVMAEKGQYVTVGAPLFRVTNIDKVEVAVPLHSEDFIKIALLVKAGQQPIVHLAENESAPARWTGRVVRVAPEADSQTRTLSVFVEIDNTQQSLPLLPGSFVQARIDGPILTDSTVVPRDAILGFSRDTGSVLIANGETIKRQPVEINRRLEGLAIVGGLNNGDQIIMSNLDVLNDSSRIVVQQTRSLESELNDQFTVRIASPSDEPNPNDTPKLEQSDE
jgi:RND family efflux transporter MFP subunit